MNETFRACNITIFDEERGWENINVTQRFIIQF